MEGKRIQMGQDKTQELLKEKLRGKGLKVTHQRLQVLSVLEENGGRHMTVEDIYEDSLLGTVVKIDHQNGLVAYYCGLNSSPSVKKGQEVEPGYQLGAIAEIPCESVEQTHLHFVMEQDGTPVSPLKVMQMKE